MKRIKKALSVLCGSTVVFLLFHRNRPIGGDEYRQGNRAHRMAVRRADLARRTCRSAVED